MNGGNVAELIVETGPRLGSRVAIRPEEPCTVGSAKDSTFSLPADMPAQAFVVKPLKGEGFGIKALASGVLLNGTELAAARLTEGDLITCGTTRFRYTEEQAPEERLLGGFRLLTVLGKGGMGTVYQAEQVSLHRHVALKVLSHELTKDPVFVAGFVAEARAAARLSHPNVVQVFDVGHDGDTYYYSMELMADGSLEQLLKGGAAMPVDKACAAILDAAKGLAYAESLRIVHRDIKPDNLMLDAHDVVKIVDLGLAQSDEESVVKVVGTPHFMAPEQVLKQSVDHRTDLYSLGCTFYRLVTGTTPFKGSSAKEILRAQVKEEPEPAHKVNPEVPVEISAIISRLMQKDPAARFQSAGELIEALSAAMTPPVRKGPWIAVALAGLAVAITTIVVLLQRKDPEPVEPQVITITDEAGAAATEAARRELEAERAQFSVERSGLAGMALAEAYDKVATDHLGTKAAGTATTRAKEIRARIAAEEAAAAERLLRLNSQLTALEKRFAGTLPDGAPSIQGLREAHSLLDATDIDEDLRDDELVLQFVSTARNQLKEQVETLKAGLLAAATVATEQRDANKLRTAAQAIEQALADGGLPAELRGDTKGLQAAAEGAETLVKALAAEAKAAREAAGQRLLVESFTRPDGVLARVQTFHSAAAAEILTGLSANLADTSALSVLTPLRSAIEAAARCEAALATSVAANRLEIVLDEEVGPVPAVGFSTTGAEAGLTVRSAGRLSTRTTLVPLSDLAGKIVQGDVRFQEGDMAPADLPAFVALHVLAWKLESARGFLAQIDPAAPATNLSGTLTFDSAALHKALILLESSSEPWSEALRQEVIAARDLELALRAFAAERYTTAAAQLERILRAHGDRLVVAGLSPQVPRDR